MELRAGDARQVVVMASPEEIRAAMAAADDAAAAPRSIATETQRWRIVDTYRARHFLAHRSVADSLRHTRRSEMLRETQRLQEEIRALQEQIESTTRSVESMERLAFCLEQLTRDFEPSDRRDGVRVLHESVVTQNVGLLTADAPRTNESDSEQQDEGRLQHDSEQEEEERRSVG
ncbi:uncharacterized protein KRP23_4677 [Phytophthora ramorum]|uniref:uncharacterized protein n=1 Tax=Phytophthora ramorum TaxID=164328 RepID=UPI003095B08D|nr:hypothetical protein KRP23_4677 [Phytophthora ramorum]